MPAWTRPLAADYKERRPSTPAKYSNVKPVVRSGFNELRARAQNQNARPQARFQHGECFKRIKGKGPMTVTAPSEVTQQKEDSLIQARQLAGLISGHEQGVALLVLDVRDVEEHRLCHIRGAIPYPARLLSRAVNPLSNEVLEFVNSENCIIVICDWDGNIAAPACALLAEKGVQNIVLLHGGLRVFAEQHAELLEGDSSTLCSPRQGASVASSTVSRGTSCSAAVRRAREHMRHGQPGGDAWPLSTSLIIAPPRVAVLKKYDQLIMEGDIGSFNTTLQPADVALHDQLVLLLGMLFVLNHYAAHYITHAEA